MLESYKFSLSFIAWMALVSFLSLYEFSPDNDIDIEVPNIDKIVHFFFYFIAAILACLFIRERSNGRLPIRKAMLYTAIFLILFGLGIEILQEKITTYRSGDIFDLIANTTGILVSLFVINYVFSSKSGLNWRH